MDPGGQPLLISVWTVLSSSAPTTKLSGVCQLHPHHILLVRLLVKLLHSSYTETVRIIFVVPLVMQPGLFDWLPLHVPTVVDDELFIPVFMHLLPFVHLHATARRVMSTIGMLYGAGPQQIVPLMTHLLPPAHIARRRS